MQKLKQKFSKMFSILIDKHTKRCYNTYKDKGYDLPPKERKIKYGKNDLYFCSQRYSQWRGA